MTKRLAFKSRSGSLGKGLKLNYLGRLFGSQEFCFPKRLGYQISREVEIEIWALYGAKRMQLANLNFGIWFPLNLPTGSETYE